MQGKTTFRHPGRALIQAAAVLLSIACMKPAHSAAKPPANILPNPGFESASDGKPQSWIFDDAVKSRGAVALDADTRHSGRCALRLEPNANNTDSNHLLGVVQIIPVEKLHGKRLRLGGWMRETGKARAFIIAIAFDAKNKPAGTGMTFQPFATSSFTRQDVFVNVTPDTKMLIVGCSVSGTSGEAWFDDLTVTEDKPTIVGTPKEPLTASIGVDASRTVRMIPRTLYGNNIEWIWNADSMWDPDARRVRPEMLAPARELGIGPLRFPGGFFSDYYHWRDGIGPAEQRPARPHAPASDTSPNSFGTDELARFCQEIGAEPLVTVNMITGTPEEAADWVRYCNSPTNPERAKNGSEKPYDVRFWEIGNEQYLTGDDPVSLQSHLDTDEYIRRLMSWSAAMKKADPAVKIVGVGSSNYGRNIMGYDEAWCQKLLKQAGSSIDYISLHCAYAPAGASSTAVSFDEVYQSLLAFPVLIAKNLRKLNSEIERFAPADKDRIKIAVTEWGALFAIDPKDKWIDHCKTLGSALYDASTLKAFIEAPRMDLATFFKISEYSFMGCIAGDGTPKPSYYALQMYSRHFGDRLLTTGVTSPTYDSKPVMQLDPVAGVPYLEAISSLSADRSKLYVIVINKHFTAPIRTRLHLTGFHPGPTGKAWVLTGPSLDANNGKDLVDYPGLSWGKQVESPRNPSFYSGKPGTVVTREKPLTGVSSDFDYTFPPISVTCLELGK